MTIKDLLGRLTRLAEIRSEQVAGNASERVAGLPSEYLAGLIGIRSKGYGPSHQPGRYSSLAASC